MRLRITVEGKTYDVDVEVLDDAGTTAPSAPRPAAASAQEGRIEPPAPSPAASPAPPAAADDTMLQSPIAGTIISVAVSPGDVVDLNQVLLVMEAMKMETNVASPNPGTIKAVHVRAGDSVKQGQPLVEFE